MRNALIRYLIRSYIHLSDVADKNNLLSIVLKF